MARTVVPRTAAIAALQMKHYAIVDNSGRLKQKMFSLSGNTKHIAHAVDFIRHVRIEHRVHVVNDASAPLQRCTVCSVQRHGRSGRPRALVIDCTTVPTKERCADRPTVAIATVAARSGSR